jgi:hypothetical protein
MEEHMTGKSSNTVSGAGILDGLREELISDDRALASVVPVLSHVLAHPGEPLVSDEVVARMRGLVAGIAMAFPTSTNAESCDALASELAKNGNLVSHCYALGVEGAITQSLSENYGIEPSLPALVQELIGSKEAAIAELAMAFMASQARFSEGHNRGTAALYELPSELFDAAVTAWKLWASSNKISAVSVDLADAEAELRARYDEGSTRLGLLNRMLSAIGASSQVLAEIETAGLAIFASATAKEAGQPRELVILSCQTQQSLRLALALKASGRSSEAILHQFAFLGRNIVLPADFDEWDAKQATDILNASPLSAKGEA